MGSTPVKIDPNEVIRIFSLRAGGMSVKDIATKYPFSTATVASVLYRRRDAAVPIPPKMLEAVQKTYRQPRKRKTCNLPPVSIESALAQYTAAVSRLESLRKDCIELGIPHNALDLLASAIIATRKIKQDKDKDKK